ncbi:M48 family metallopeptidase [Shewanella sp. 202IG2-18]|uniref:M48 family metallopeptidase n=1 Tax=Parashewanella hymeniacidonis TaxID=2807618 RepID=UPI001960340C|nr:M48 family metallopeptidase [Parashewanella hymeniacidonis]MBM7073283.1 M48 family metallopeptidase [Parashewanella hymeniacidonis]
MIEIIGDYHLSGSAQFICVRAVLKNDHSISLFSRESGELIHQYFASDYEVGTVIPSLSIDLEFNDGSLFTPDDASFKWPQLTSKKTLASWLETHWTFVIGASLFVPFFLWIMVTKVLPAAADASVPLLPDFVAQQTGKQTLAVLDETMLEPSKLKQEQQDELRNQWQQMIVQLQLPNQKLHLYFRDADIGANAFALPDGSVIVTDDIVELMKPHPNALKAVLLHEIGHVEHQHGMKQLARSTAITMLFALMLGDIEGAGEMIIGAGSSLLQASFSRDMEREADEYSHQQLKQLGISPSAFGEAIKLLEQAHGEKLDKSAKGLNHWLEYLNSHPSSEERIEKANNK